VLWLADRHPPSATAAADLLAALSPAWSRRRVVPVHVLADEEVRADEGWRFRLRALWLAVSNSLREVLDTRFVAVSIGDFRSAGGAQELESLHAAVWEAQPDAPPEGVLAVFVARPGPEAPGSGTRGLAEFAGRRITLRLGPEGPRAELALLAHEILHLYAGVHVAPELESLMNPTGESMVLDAFNQRIVRAMRPRRFGTGGIAGDVLPWIDVGETREALLQSLSANLEFRRLGLAEAIRTSELSRLQASRRWNEARQLDPHLGDVASFLAELSLFDGRRAEAAALLEVAAELHGASVRGRAARERADALRINP
jgi:hypothetical protein